MEKTRIFVTCKNEDLVLVDTLRAWDVDNEFEFFHEPALPRIGIHTADGKAHKAVLTEKIKTGTHFLCLIGKLAGDNDWINWEVQTASVTGRKVIAVRLAMGNKSPAALLNFGATWAKDFSFEAIKKAIAVGASSSMPVAALPPGVVDADGGFG